MRHWNSPAAVIWMYRPTPSRAWCERLRVDPCPNCPRPQLKSQLVVTFGDHVFQSHPCFTIHYAHNEILEQSSCCDMDIQTHTVTSLVRKAHNETLEQSSCCNMDVQTHTVTSLVLKVGLLKPKLPPPTTEKPACGDFLRP
eukprot:scaffold34948_cov74-Cyclotella_meneghiniana.AAC.9